MTCPACGREGLPASPSTNLCGACLLGQPFLPPEDGRDHFHTGRDDWDRDADSRAADQELGDE